MIIAVYANLKAYLPSDPYKYFLKSLIKRLAIAYPEDIFFLIQTDSTDELINKLPNLQTIFLNPSKGLFFKYLFNRKIVRVIQNIKADAVLSADVIIKTHRPLCILINKIENENFRLENLQKIQTIFCLSQTLKEELIRHGVDSRKINIVYGGPAWSIKQDADLDKKAIKEKYTNGKEFFLYRGPIEKKLNIISLLKAFSLFKKRQKSTMKLVLIGEQEWEEQDFSGLIKSYKYRDEIIFTDNIEKDKEAQLISAAFAFIQPFKSASLSFAFDALQNNVPVLIDVNSSLREIAPQAALYFDMNSAEDMAHKLMLIYKDEKFYNNLVEKGKEIIAKDYWQETTKTIWQNLQQAGS
jgi:glycosyltransferase involved in cell wall biosynthesis